MVGKMKEDKDYFYFDKGEAVKLSKSFSSDELACKCKLDSCKEQKLSKRLIERLQALRDEVGVPIKVHSGLRCKEHNTKVGGHPSSSHVNGLAADISTPDLNKLHGLCEKHFDNIGNGTNKGFIHVDVRDPKGPGLKRRWLY